MRWEERERERKRKRKRERVGLLCVAQLSRETNGGMNVLWAGLDFRLLFELFGPYLSWFIRMATERERVCVCGKKSQLNSSLPPPLFLFLFRNELSRDSHVFTPPYPIGLGLFSLRSLSSHSSIPCFIYLLPYFSLLRKLHLQFKFFKF